MIFPIPRDFSPYSTIFPILRDFSAGGMEKFPGAVLPCSGGLYSHAFISIPFLKVKRMSSLLYTVAYSTRLYQSSSLNSVSGPSRFSRAETNLPIFSRYYSLDYLHPKSPFLPRLVESTDVSSQAENPSPSLHLRFLCYHTFVTRLKKQEPQPSKVKLLPSSIRGLRRFITCL